MLIQKAISKNKYKESLKFSKKAILRSVFNAIRNVSLKGD